MSRKSQQARMLLSGRGPHRVCLERCVVSVHAFSDACGSPCAGLLGFLSGITPVSGASGFAPSTSSGSGLGAGAATDAAAMPTSSSAAFPAFGLPSGAPTFGRPAPEQESSGLKQVRPDVPIRPSQQKVYKAV